jgi:predicted ArsR family transcriptional regulator
VSKQTREKIFEAVRKHGPISIPHLAQKLNMLPPTINWQIQQLHAEKLVYVHSYSQQKSKTHTRIWAAGDQPDADRGKKFDRSEYYFGTEYDDIDDKRTKTLSEEQIEAMDARREQKRREEILKHIKPFRDPMLFLTCGREAA